MYDKNSIDQFYIQFCLGFFGSWLRSRYCGPAECCRDTFLHNTVPTHNKTVK